jgi:predicted transcriptional regulator of viral defense system
MKKSIQNFIAEVANSDVSIITTAELKAKNLNAYDIDKLVKEGHIKRIKRGIYKISDESGDYGKLQEAAFCVPNGVICLTSAQYYHGLIKREPNQIAIAIPHKAKKPVLPKYLNIKLYYFTEPRYSLGRTLFYDLGTECYDMEKSICDAIYYRKKLGTEIAKEALITYLQRKDKDIDKLIEYGENLRVGKILKNYLEVLL